MKKSLDDIISIPGIPDKPSIDGVGVSDFDNFSLFTACMETEAKFSAKMLKLQSTLMTASLMISAIRNIAKPLLGKEFDGTNSITDFNIDSGVSKINSPKIAPIPECLSNSLNKFDNNISDEAKNTFQTLSDYLSTENNVTYSSNGFMDDALAQFDNLNNKIKEVKKYMEKIMGNLVSKGDKTLFQALDKFQSFVNDTNFVQDYRDFKDMLRCIKNNCPQLSEYLADDSFLFYDENKREFIMPIEMNSGKIKINKFFQSLNQLENNRCYEIQKRYDKYLSDKRDILVSVALNTDSSSVSYLENPFAAVADEIGLDNKNVVNTLF